MGLFNFIQNAGRMLGIGGNAVQDESKPAPPPPAADAIEGELKSLGLHAPDMKLSVEGNTVKVSGTAPDAETREKIILAAGNVAGIDKVDDSLATPTAGAEPKLYTVVRGDTLSGIAQKLLGSASKYPAIFEANKPMLKDPDLIYPGQVLRIPQA